MQYKCSLCVRVAPLDFVLCSLRKCSTNQTETKERNFRLERVILKDLRSSNVYSSTINLNFFSER